MTPLDTFTKAAREALDKLEAVSMVKGASVYPPNDYTKDEALAALTAAAVELVIAELEGLSMDVVQPCEPDCDDVRHALHMGSWNAYIVIGQRLAALTKGNQHGE